MIKKISLVIVVCIACFSLSFSQEESSVKRDYNLKTEGANTINGIVRSVVPSDLTRVRSAIIVTDENGKEREFELRPSAVIYNGMNGKLLSLKELKTGDKVRIDFLDFKFGIPKATGVKLLHLEESLQEEWAK